MKMSTSSQILRRIKTSDPEHFWYRTFVSTRFSGETHCGLTNSLQVEVVAWDESLTVCTVVILLYGCQPRSTGCTARWNLQGIASSPMAMDPCYFNATGLYRNRFPLAHNLILFYVAFLLI